MRILDIPEVPPRRVGDVFMFTTPLGYAKGDTVQEARKLLRTVAEEPKQWNLYSVHPDTYKDHDGITSPTDYPPIKVAEYRDGKVRVV